MPLSRLRDDGILRRYDYVLLHEYEKILSDVSIRIDELPASELLTATVVMLIEVRHKLADYLESEVYNV